ncbi:MAG: N-acetyltransferase family protein [Bryobacteraceae bacterium]
MGLHIRRARLEDAPAIAALVRALGWFAHLSAEAEQVGSERVAKHLQLCRADQSHSVYVAEDQAGEVAAYATVHWLPYLFFPGPEGYVSELIVGEAHRGRGIGTQLLEAVRREALERGCCRLMLINKRNRESYQREFYAKRGWIERPAAASFVLPLK